MSPAGGNLDAFPSTAPGPMMPTPRQILCIRLKSLGDIVFTLPAVDCLKVNHPGSVLSFLTSSEYRGLLTSCPSVDHVVTLDRQRLKQGSLVARLRELWRCWRAARAGRPDLVVDFQGYGETGVLTRLVGARARWGQVYRASRRWFYTHGVWRDDTLHPIDANLRLLAECGLKVDPPAGRLTVPRAASEQAAAMLETWGIGADARFVFIQPFTSSAEKDWPLEHSLELTRSLSGAGVRVVFGGGPTEVARLEPVRALGIPVAAGCSLEVALALLARSTVVVGGDTGLCHAAMALGRRVVMLLKELREGVVFPYGHRDWTLTPPPGSRVMHDIHPARVFEAIVTALGERPHPPAVPSVRPSTPADRSLEPHANSVRD